MYNKNNQSGFTLVELVVTVAVISVLAVSMMPMVIGVAGDAKSAATLGVAGALTAAGARNYSRRSANLTKGVAVLTCADAINAIELGSLPSGYRLPLVGDTAVVLDEDGTTIAAPVLGTALVTADALNVCTVVTKSEPRRGATFIAYGVI